MFIEDPPFPRDLSYGSGGGPRYRTDMVELVSGVEERNQTWTYSRARFNAAFGVRTDSQLDTLIDWFHVAEGKTHGFRFRDWADYKSCGWQETPAFDDQVIGVGDGATTDFPLIKTYTQGAVSRTRLITKPLTGTVLAASAGLEVTAFTVDTATGIISFTTAPANGETLTAGYEYDIPVRFDTDELNVVLDNYLAGSLDVPLVEIRL